MVDGASSVKQPIRRRGYRENGWSSAATESWMEKKWRRTSEVCFLVGKLMVISLQQLVRASQFELIAAR